MRDVSPPSIGSCRAVAAGSSDVLGSCTFSHLMSRRSTRLFINSSVKHKVCRTSHLVFVHSTYCLSHAAWPLASLICRPFGSTLLNQHLLTANISKPKAKHRSSSDFADKLSNQGTTDYGAEMGFNLTPF